MVAKCASSTRVTMSRVTCRTMSSSSGVSNTAGLNRPAQLIALAQVSSAVPTYFRGSHARPPEFVPGWTADSGLEALLSPVSGSPQDTHDCFSQPL